jgi:hypothetical protein
VLIVYHRFLLARYQSKTPPIHAAVAPNSRANSGSGIEAVPQNAGIAAYKPTITTMAEFFIKSF